MRLHRAIRPIEDASDLYSEVDLKLKEAFPDWMIDTSLIETVRFKNEYVWIFSVEIKKYHAGSTKDLIIHRHIQWDRPTMEEVLAAHSIEEVIELLSEPILVPIPGPVA